MIHVQIARDITTVGVEGVRWVLLEASEVDPPVAPAPAAALPTAPPALSAAAPARSGRSAIGRWQLAITGLGLLAALGLAQRQLGQPRLPWLGAPALSQPRALPPLPSAPPALLAAPLAAPPKDEAGASPMPAVPDTSRPADAPVSDDAGPALPSPAASATQVERLITAGLR